jgi:dihydroorotate dehydrogenase
MLAGPREVYTAFRSTKRSFVVGCGGIFSAEDAYKKNCLGANLIQLITGMIFEGSQLVASINQGLVSLLKRDGYTNISEAVGRDNIF